MPRPLTRVASLAGAAVATLALGGCGSSHNGYLAVALDPAGRLVAVVAVCGTNKLDSITLSDDTSRRTVTSHPAKPPAFGGSLILTSPIDNPRPEGEFDMLEKTHQYTLSASLHDESGEDAGATTTISFKLETLLGATEFRSGAVLALSPGDGDAPATTMFKDQFVAQAATECA